MMTREKMVDEAVERMHLLGVMPSVVRKFKNHGIVMVSEPPFGGLYELDDEEKKMVSDIEERYGGLVYMVVRQPTEFGLCDSLLWVSQYEEEWEDERDCNKDGIVFTYTVNHDVDWCSEFGSISVRPAFGGLLRNA